MCVLYVDDVTGSLYIGNTMKRTTKTTKTLTNAQMLRDAIRVLITTGGSSFEDAIASVTAGTNLGVQGDADIARAERLGELADLEIWAPDGEAPVVSCEFNGEEWHVYTGGGQWDGPVPTWIVELTH